MGRMNITGAGLKRLLNEKFDVIASSVRRGRGTSHGWWYITTQERIDPELTEKIGNFLVKEKLAGTYFSDYGAGNDGYRPAILWQKSP